MTFQSWTAELIKQRFGTATALANKVGMQLSPFSRGVAAGTLNLVNLLKLAQVADEKPSVVLRLAGKGKEAHLLEDLYGSANDALTASERMVLALWRGLEPAARGSLLELMIRLHPNPEQVIDSLKTPRMSSVQDVQSPTVDVIATSDADSTVSVIQVKHTSETGARIGAKKPRRRRHDDHPREKASEETALKKRGRSGSSE